MLVISALAGLGKGGHITATDGRNNLNVHGTCIENSSYNTLTGSP